MFELIFEYLKEEGRQAEKREQEEHTKRLIEEFDEAQKEEEVRRKARTLDEISEGVRLHRKKIEQTMKENEDQFVHWPHPSQPTKYALVDQIRHHQGEKSWELGLDF